MKRIILTAIVALATFAGTSAQKFAMVDMDYILKNVPAYERANEQLNQVSKKWEGEIDAILKEVESAYKKYQSEAVFLSDAQKTKTEEEIMKKEKQASDLKRSISAARVSSSRNVRASWHPSRMKSTQL